MSVIPITRLSSSDLRLLGNNLARPTKSRPRLGYRRRQQRILSAVNRSLSAVGEEVGRLHRPLAAA
jgi:hypothetical protein